LNALLLDTHTLLWALGNVGKLSPRARETLSEGVLPAYVSSATLWEMAIKRAKGKLDVPENLLTKIAAARFDELTVNFRHALLAGALPRHHGDPFDRMLVAQAQSEGLTIVTRDPRIVAYDVPVLW
jgi:PIN domain nuclease of toxin-antitoxin system